MEYAYQSILVFSHQYAGTGANRKGSSDRVIFIHPGRGFRANCFAAGYSLRGTGIGNQLLPVSDIGGLLDLK